MRLQGQGSLRMACDDGKDNRKAKPKGLYHCKAGEVSVGGL